MLENLKNSSDRMTGKCQFTLIPKKRNAKECSNYHTVALISYACKSSSKSSMLGFKSTWTQNFQMYKQDLEKTEE